MILSDTAIKAAIAAGQIKLVPFDETAIGSNSIDVRLSKHIAEYNSPVLDARQRNSVTRWEIPKEGAIFYPNRLYLGSTLEYTETHGLVPVLTGKSSIGRLGVSIHVTAGMGDAGFCNAWTLELFVLKPVRLYAGMRIGQLTYHQVAGEVERPYHMKEDAKYSLRDPQPGASQMHLNWK